MSNVISRTNTFFSNNREQEFSSLGPVEAKWSKTAGKWERALEAVSAVRWGASGYAEVCDADDRRRCGTRWLMERWEGAGAPPVEDRVVSTSVWPNGWTDELVHDFVLKYDMHGEPVEVVKVEGKTLWYVFA